MGDEYYDTLSETAYVWNEGEKLRIAKGKADEMLAIIGNSSVIAGLDF